MHLLPNDWAPSQVYAMGERPYTDRLIVGLIEKVKAIDLGALAAKGALTLVVAAGLAYTGYTILDREGATPHETTAQVLDTNYRAAYSSTTMVSTGKTFIPITTHHPEAFSALVELASKSEQVWVDVDQQSYVNLQAAIENGTHFKATYKEGKWSHDTQGVTIHESVRFQDRIHAQRGTPGTVANPSPAPRKSM